MTSMGAEPTLESLCAYSRLKPGSSWWAVALIVLWSPFGLLLAVVRAALTLAIGVLLAAIPARVAQQWQAASVQVLLTILGCRVTVKGDVQALGRAKILVANHVSQVGALPIVALQPCATLMRENYLQLAMAGGWNLGAGGAGAGG